MRSTDPGVADPPQSPEERIAASLALANRHEQEGRLDEAQSILDGILAERPEEPAALHQTGIIAYRRGHMADAAALMERSIALAPRSALFHRNICEVYRVLGRPDAALAAGQRAVALDPNDPHGHHNLGLVHYDRLELDDAVLSAELALAIDPEFASGHFGIAEASLLRGDFARGWEEYEWRSRLAGVPPVLPPTDRPQWDGKPLGRGQTLLLIADQGYGDVIQFARYLPWAAARCTDIAIACSAELQPVVAQLSGTRVIFDHWSQAPDFAAFCAFSSLPRLAGTRLATIPSATPYLHAGEAKLDVWAKRLSAMLPRGYRRIGIAWAGRPTHRNDLRRSARLSTFAPLAAIPGIALVSLQKGPAQAEIGHYWGRAPLLNLGPELRDFADTMAVIACLELVVTVDTSVAHLAGAMGKDVWIMLPFAPDWRWLLGRADSPWYPTARLFRQSADRRWEGVMAAIAEELAG